MNMEWIHEQVWQQVEMNRSWSCLWVCCMFWTHLGQANALSCLLYFFLTFPFNILFFETLFWNPFLFEPPRQTLSFCWPFLSSKSCFSKIFFLTFSFFFFFCSFFSPYLSLFSCPFFSLFCFAFCSPFSPPFFFPFLPFCSMCPCVFPLFCPSIFTLLFSISIVCFFFPPFLLVFISFLFCPLCVVFFSLFPFSHSSPSFPFFFLYLFWTWFPFSLFFLSPLPLYSSSSLFFSFCFLLPSFFCRFFLFFSILFSKKQFCSFLNFSKCCTFCHQYLSKKEWATFFTFFFFSSFFPLSPLLFSPLTPSPPLLPFFILEMPTGGKKLVLGTKGNSKTIVDWVNGQSKLDTKETSTASVQNLLRDWQGYDNGRKKWDTPMSKLGGREWLAARGGWTSLQGKRDVQSARVNETSKGKKNREKRALIFEMPTEAKELMLGVRGDSKTITGWANGHAQLKSKESTIASVQNLLGPYGGSTTTCGRLDDSHLPRTQPWSRFMGRDKRQKTWKKMGGHRDGLVWSRRSVRCLGR